MDDERSEQRIRFGAFEADLRSGELRKHGRRIRIQPQPFKVLAVLLESPGTLVSRDELRKRLWPDELYVDFEHGLNRSINKLRHTLLDDPNSPRYIETLPGRGYRFIAAAETRKVPDDPGRATGTAKARTAEMAGVAGAETIQPHQAQGIASRPHLFRRIAVWAAVLFLLVVSGTILARYRSVTHANTHRARVAEVGTRRYVYVADYSANSILAYSVDPSSGRLRPVPSNPFAAGEHPYSLSLFGDSYIYAANRGRGDGVCGKGCSISGYAIDSVSGGLVQLDASPFPAGKGPLTILVHPSGKFVFTINVVSGDLLAFTRTSGGDLRPLGAAIALGRHPINAALSPSGRYLYVSNQDDANVSGFELGVDGEPRPVPGSPFRTGLRPRSIAIDPSERRLYVLNYGVNPNRDRREACAGEYAGLKGRGCSISAFSIQQGTGALSELRGSPFESDGINPHGSVIDPTGRYLFVANITSNDVSVFEIDEETGALRTIRGSPFPAGEGSNSLALDWSGAFLYVLNGFSRDISQFAIEDDGRLSPLSQAVPAGSGPVAIVAVGGR